MDQRYIVRKACKEDCKDIYRLIQVIYIRVAYLLVSAL